MKEKSLLRLLAPTYEVIYSLAVLLTQLSINATVASCIGIGHPEI